MTPATAPSAEPAAAAAAPGTVGDASARLIDAWFPCTEVDVAVRTPAGSGRSEKALFTWFASRPIGQARAAVLCSLLPDTPQNRVDVRSAVLAGDEGSIMRLRRAIWDQYEGRAPVVLDMFSGRGIIPLEAARLGAAAAGTDLSPVATLAGRLLAEYPLRDWSAEPAIPYDLPAVADDDAEEDGDAKRRPKRGRRDPQQATIEGLLDSDEEARLLGDVRRILAEVGRRVEDRVADLYPKNPVNGRLPWAYLWAVTIPCDGCGRTFPLIGAMALRHPYTKTKDSGQSLRLAFSDEGWTAEVTTGGPTQQPTFAAAVGRRGKSARCPFPTCGHAHTLD